MTYQIIYSSESSTPMQLDDLEELLEQARSNNAAQGITGALVYVDGIFLQILEGDRTLVDALMAKISKDLRHETVTVLREAEVSSAVFRDWKMAFVSATAEQVAMWAGLTRTAGVSEVLAEMQQDSHRAAQVAQNILSLLAPENTGHSETD